MKLEEYTVELDNATSKPFRELKKGDRFVRVMPGKGVFGDWYTAACDAYLRDPEFGGSVWTVQVEDLSVPVEVPHD
jgi:hypothetical protein